MELYANRCVVCGIDIGDCNPRQLCCKTYCPMEINPDATQPIDDPDATQPIDNPEATQPIDDIYVNRCIVCGVDMGDCNPRQLCCKTYCPMENESK